ncbi:polysaccharide lyase family 1 protein [Piromyces sp. E2]|nr:polysaccharide lyase family 1 protein [Piromyces sp. E2]|eukprot:OUM56482.1 polysaccharide lyase family 1 protein [Piromyces sp. E2]
MKFSKLNLELLFFVTSVFANSPIGFGNKATGGEGGVEYHVNTFKELINALDNNGNPTAPKIIYIDSPMNGLIDENGKEITAEDLVPGYSFQKYLECFSNDGLQWFDTDECNKIENLRKQGTPIQEKYTKAIIPSNTSIIGSGDNTQLEEVSLNINNADNVVIKNLSI